MVGRVSVYLVAWSLLFTVVRHLDDSFPSGALFGILASVLCDVIFGIRHKEVLGDERTESAMS